MPIYGALKEINELTISSKSFEYHYPGGDIISFPTGHFPPFDTIFLYDNILGKNDRTSRRELITEMMADFIYVDMFLWEQQASTFTNLVEKHSKANLDKYSRKCIYNVSGTTSINLPSIKDLLQFLAIIFCKDIFIELFSTDSMDKLTEENTTENNNGENKSSRKERAVKNLLNKIEQTIKESKEEMEKKIINWNQDEIKKMATTMYEVWENWSNFDAISPKLEKWKNELFANDGKTEFTFGTNLTVESEAYSKIIIRAKEQLNSEISKIINSQDSAVEKKKTATLIYNFITQLIKRLQTELEYPVKALEDEFADPGGIYEAITREMQKTIEAKPWVMMKMEKLAFVSILIRFLSNFVFGRGYEKIKKIRVNKYAMNILQDALEKSNVKTIEKDSSLSELSFNLKEKIYYEYEKYEKNIAAKTNSNEGSITEGSIVDIEYMENIWNSVKDKLKTDSIRADFEKYCFQKYGITDISGTEQFEEVFKAALGFSNDLLVQKYNEKEIILEPLEYCSDDKLELLISRAKNDHHIENTVTNPTSKNIVFLSIPEFSKASSKIGEQTKRVKTLINNIFGSPIISDSYKSMYAEEKYEPQLVIKYISLYHPSTNIYGISKYYDYYLNYSTDFFNNVMFHLSKDYIEFPEIISKEIGVKCGNKGCDYDITKLNRDAIICPNCNNPIKNRCGNKTCSEDNLSEYEPIKSKFCPVCDNELKTRWWVCPRHNKTIDTNSVFCPDCVSDYKSGLIKSKDICVLKGNAHIAINCHGCFNSDIPLAKINRITFPEFYEEVKVSQIESANKIYFDKNLTNKGNCPVCNNRVLPTCPYYDKESGETPHYVHRKEVNGHNVFICSHEHYDKDIYECDNCGLPVKGDEKFCPRCSSKFKSPPAYLLDKSIAPSSVKSSEWTEEEIKNFEMSHIFPIDKPAKNKNDKIDNKSNENEKTIVSSVINKESYELGDNFTNKLAAKLDMTEDDFKKFIDSKKGE